ncbi:MAG TPA: hypothetical protein DDX92_05000 [Flavobacteriales bacterium]|jgi:dihydrofolate reductase|nr:hypothetical protein [Flavobacteriales bacterium]
MTSLDALRNRLIDQILLTKNEKLLNAISDIFQSTNNEDKVELNSYQIEMIEMGLEDLKNGNTISQNELDRQDAKWMGEQ